MHEYDEQHGTHLYSTTTKTFQILRIHFHMNMFKSLLCVFILSFVSFLTAGIANSENKTAPVYFLDFFLMKV